MVDPKIINAVFPEPSNMTEAEAKKYLAWFLMGQKDMAEQVSVILNNTDFTKTYRINKVFELFERLMATKEPRIDI